MAVWAKCLVGRRVWPNGKESFEDMNSYIRGRRFAGQSAPVLTIQHLVHPSSQDVQAVLTKIAIMKVTAALVVVALSMAAAPAVEAADAPAATAAPLQVRTTP